MFSGFKSFWNIFLLAVEQTKMSVQGNFGRNFETLIGMIVTLYEAELST